MTDRPKIEWTDEELRGAWGNTHVFQGKADVLREFLASLPAYSPAECRERERDAWDACAKYELCGSYGVCAAALRVARDDHYPSLAPPPPPALTLSHGSFVREDDGFWRRQGTAQFGKMFCPDIRTASDARALAAWLAQYGSEEERK